MKIKDQIVKALEEITGVKEINLEFTENPDFGDYTSNIALVLAKSKGQNQGNWQNH